MFLIFSPTQSEIYQLGKNEILRIARKLEFIYLCIYLFIYLFIHSFVYFLIGIFIHLFSFSYFVLPFFSFMTKISRLGS